jgi:uncharacterized protein (DUF58 family)
LCHDAVVPLSALRSGFQKFLRYSAQRRTTPVGLVFAVAALLVAFTAVVSANNLLFLILAAMISILLISNFICRLSLAGLELDFHLPEHLSARRTFPARIFVRNGKRWMPSFSVEVAGVGESAFSTPLYFPVLPGGSTLEETVEVRFDRRGLHREDGFEFSTSFPFGFLERRANVTLRRDILVYPCLDPQPGFEELLDTLSGEIVAHYRGRGHDFYRIRPYVAFESARHVDWKATAHTNELQVREFAREEEPLVEILLDLDVPAAHREWFDRAVDCCAYTTWHVVRREARVRFSTQDFRLTVPATGDIYTILKYLAMVSPKASKPPAGPHEENSFQIVFSASPERYPVVRWRNACVVGPDLLPAPPPRRGAARAGQEFDHGGRTDHR